MPRPTSATRAADTSRVFGVPPYAYLGGDYVLDGSNNRVSLFAQDSWAVGKRLTIEPGLRFDMHRGYLRNFDGRASTIRCSRRTSSGPRIGFAFDLTGKSKTVLRGHYGRYFDGAKTTYFTLLADREPTFGAYIDPVTLQPLDEPYLIDRGISQTTIDDDLKHPKMDQYILGIRTRIVPRFRGRRELHLPQELGLHRRHPHQWRLRSHDSGSTAVRTTCRHGG